MRRFTTGFVLGYLLNALLAVPLLMVQLGLTGTYRAAAREVAAAIYDQTGLEEPLSALRHEVDLARERALWPVHHIVFPQLPGSGVGHHWGQG